MDAEGLRESFIPVALQAGTDGEGRILGLPFYTGTDALYYRLDHFEEAGLDPNAPPKTWEELAEAATALTNPRAGRYGFGMYGKTHTVRCIHFMQNNGPDGEMLRLDRDTGIWTILVNSPDSIGAIEYMVSLARDLKVVPPNVVEMDYPANVAAFSAGNISMLTTGPWGAQTFIGTNPEIEGKFGVALHPTPTGDAGAAAGLADLRRRPHDGASGRGVPLPQVVHPRPPAVLRGQRQVRTDHQGGAGRSGDRRGSVPVGLPRAIAEGGGRAIRRSSWATGTDSRSSSIPNGRRR